MNGPVEPSAEVLSAGEAVLMVDSRQRRYLIRLADGGEFHTHAGAVAHDEIIGTAEGTEFRSSAGARFLALRPTLSDHVLKMPRGAQVIYPKDLGAIAMLADIRAGMSVFETGVGSGAMSAVLLRAGAHVTGYELRADFAQRAMDNVAAIEGPAALDRYCVELRDSYEGVDPPPPRTAQLAQAAKPSLPGQPNLSAQPSQPGVSAEDQRRGYDRAVLDIPEPWQVVPHLEARLRRGAVLVAYNPSVTQVQQLRRTLAQGPWALAETVEVLHRSWHVEGASVRPDHRMVAHTGFLTHARLIAGD